MSDTEFASPPDPRPALGSWAPGDYYNHCRACDRPYIGDKRSTMCAPCAYTKKDPLKDLLDLPPEQRVVAVIDHAFGGVHHVKNLRKHTESKYPYWSCSFYAPVCNWDFDNLSRLVVASLEYGVRVELGGGGPNKMKLQLFPRYTRDGAIHHRIPRLEHFATDFDYNNRLTNAQ